MHLRTQSRAPEAEPKRPPGCKMDTRLSSHTATQGNRFVSARMRSEWMVGYSEVEALLSEILISTYGLPVKRAQSTTSNHAVDLALLLAENEIPWLVATLLAA